MLCILLLPLVLVAWKELRESIKTKVVVPKKGSRKALPSCAGSSTLRFCSITGIPLCFFEIPFMEGSMATVVFNADCPWDKLLDNASEQQDQALVERILRVVDGDKDIVAKSLVLAIQQQNSSMVEMFLKFGVSPNHPVLPLQVCARVGDIDTMHVLLEARANVNATNSDHDTALHFAACRNDPAFVEVLMAAGANPSIENKLGETASMAYCSSSWDTGSDAESVSSSVVSTITS